MSLKHLQMGPKGWSGAGEEKIEISTRKGLCNPGLERGLCSLGMMAPAVNFKLQTHLFYYMKW